MSQFQEPLFLKALYEGNYILFIFIKAVEIFYEKFLSFIFNEPPFLYTKLLFFHFYLLILNIFNEMLRVVNIYSYF